MRAVVLVLVAARLRAFNSDDQVEATVAARAALDARAVRAGCPQFQGDSGKSSGSSRLSTAACSWMTMGLDALALPLAGIATDRTVNTEYGAKRNSSSPCSLCAE